MNNDADTSQKFKVTITETLKKIVEVDADNRQQAEQIVSDGWHRSEYILNADYFANVEFEAMPMVERNT